MKLVVFFSRGMSLEGWQRAGILDRELALYRALLPHLESLTFLTYGGAVEQELALRLPGLRVLTNRWHLPANLYSILAPLMHWRALAGATIFKTNQINGAWCAVIATRLFHKKLVVRCGFVWSEFVARLHGGTWRQAAALRLERQAVRRADVVIVATEADRHALVTSHDLDERRVQVIPNYVDTSLFRPMPDVTRTPGRVICVGRLDDQKNLMALVEAMGQVPDATLVLVGDGPRRGALETAAAQQGVRVTFLGTRSHDELPGLLNQASVFILPSHYEGNPKALIEAMACGMPVIGTRAPGIEEIIVHRQNGYLCGPSAGEIAAALRDVLGDAALRDRIGAGALAYAHSTSTVESAVARELALLRLL